jgi:hypothetical protein
MAIETAEGGALSSSYGHSRTRLLLGIGVVLLVALVAVVVAALTLSGVTLAGDATALARVSVQPLGGSSTSRPTAPTAGASPSPSPADA